MHPSNSVPGAVPDFSCDVLVIGGGPAGSTLGTLLARRGRDVHVLEKEHHPRFHIGESLLPANVRLFDELGVRADVEKMGMPKWGVEFVSPEHERQNFIEFSEALDKSQPYAWQVRRSELDELLFRTAGEAGARTLEGHRAREVQFDADGALVQVERDDGSRATWRCRYLVDATGRDTLLANKFKTKQKHPDHNSSALFGHFTGARRLEGKLEGNITIFWFDHGWFWFIPLADGTTSVGAVVWPYYLKTRNKPLPEFFRDTIAACPALADRLRDATLVDEKVHATGNYSYIGTHCAGDRYAMLGDAYAFVDPVFSSGVYLAMSSAFAALPLVEATLQRGPAAAARERAGFDRFTRQGPKEFSWFIYRVTNPTMRGFFMMSGDAPFRVKEAVLTVLAGDVHGRTPFRLPLTLFKGLYYAVSFAHPLRTWNAWRRRRRNIRDLDAAVS
ncbi:NAD(P)/FAD-dependent oxidoreductase [Ramlibacter sp.]|uniref:NAD(P)/FAD-dependent oxidoreductase n=1 Tax=Ramlibacter sp. TaxID=1917967 RepID=UPI002FCB856E